MRVPATLPVLLSTTYFTQVQWQLCTLIPWIGTTDFLLQIFLTWRIYAVSGKKWRVFPAIAMLFSIAGTILPYVSCCPPSISLLQSH